MPCPVFSAHDIPFTLNTDPPSIRDPRPALTVVAAVARTPVEIDPTRWLDQDEPTPSVRPADYLVHRVEAPLGLTPDSPTNPMCLTVEQALAAMTFWAAYVSRQEDEIGAIAVPAPGSDLPGWHADLVVWAANPLAIRSNQGMTLDELGAVPAGTNDAARVDMVNAFIGGFRPRMTVVDGLPVYVHGLV
jgi:predicted amidohydrolase YtcJ